VLPDVAALRRTFDYSIPTSWHDDGRAGSITVGTMVRAELHGRRIAGWVTELDPATEPGVALRPLTRLSGVGPPAALVDLAMWSAWRWAGAPSAFLRTASPPTMVPRVVQTDRSSAAVGDVADWAHAAFAGTGSVVRVPPLGDRWPLILAAVARGNALIVVPSIHQSQVVAGRLRRLGVRVGLHPRDWALGAGGATVVGGRTAAFAPVADLAAIVMIDEHDEVYQQEQAPTWHAREVLIERAAREGVPIVVTSPIPTPEARAASALLDPGRPAERAGWPMVRVVDLRTDDSARGTLWTSALVRAFDVEGRVAVVLNRKGRARLLACASCDSLATCTECSAALRQSDNAAMLECPNGHRRPVVCDTCGATRFKQLRVGVTRAREELEALLREPVAEVTGDAEDLPVGRVLVGTEAVLHRVDGLDAVAFVDFDQELAAPRYRSAEQALALLVRAGRLVGGRRDGAGEVLIQTRQPDHPAIRAAVTADVETWAQGEMARRRILRYPPYAALAHVSGAVADEYIARLGSPPGIEVRGPVDGAWLVRADDPATLADALAAVERPKGRVRVAVDPLRI
jgi:primosomal protein N' (replication factor Y)